MQRTYEKATYTSSGSGLGEKCCGSAPPDRRAERRTKMSVVVVASLRLQNRSRKNKHVVGCGPYDLSRARGLEGDLDGEFSFGTSTTIGSISLNIDEFSWTLVTASHTALAAGPLNHNVRIVGDCRAGTYSKIDFPSFPTSAPTNCWTMAA